MDVASFGDFSGAVVAAVMGKEKWKQTKGCTPSTELIILNDILKNGSSGSLTSVLRKVKRMRNKKEYELLIVSF